MFCSKAIVQIFAFFSLTAGAVLLSACQKGAGDSPSSPTTQSPEKPISTQASGFINGHAWQFKSGKAVLYQRNQTDYMEISLWDKVMENPCNEWQGSTYQIRVYTPYATGSHAVNSEDPFAQFPAIVFSDMTEMFHPNNNIVADQGSIQINSIGEKVSGSLQGSFPTGLVQRTEVAGAFLVPFCPN